MIKRVFFVVMALLLAAGHASAVLGGQKVPAGNYTTSAGPRFAPYYTVTFDVTDDAVNSVRGFGGSTLDWDAGSGTYIDAAWSGHIMIAQVVNGAVTGSGEIMPDGDPRPSLNVHWTKN